MTKDDIIRMAREAGFKVGDWHVQGSTKELKSFAALVAAREREACAKACEEIELAFDIGLWCDSTKKEITAHTAHGLAAAIRARSTNSCQNLTKLVETPRLQRAGSFGD